MKKSLLIACLSVAGVFAVCASIMVLANNGKEVSGESSKNISTSSYEKSDKTSEISTGRDVSSIETDIAAIKNDNTPEGKMRKQLNDEYNAIYAEVYESLNDEDYENYPEDFRESHKRFDAEQETKNRTYQKVHEVVEKYSGYKVDSSDQRREALNELIEVCCGVVNDTKTQISLEDRTRLVIYLEEVHTLMTRSDFQQTDRDKEDIELIENTIVIK